jgi:hypothetical protein
VKFHDKSDLPTVQTFEIEMAPIKYVPHAVHFFLEQVGHGLWNGSSFHLNRHHVLQVGPSSPEHRERFREMELDRLAFPEYSPHYPHHRWTLGYAGRPGGPSWYVNKIDNRADHGPHGQEHHALSEYADPCFGKVVQGFATLERVFRDPILQPSQQQQQRATILSAEIVRWQDHWTRDDPGEWRREHGDFADSTDLLLGGDEDDGGGWFDEDDDHDPRLVSLNSRGGGTSHHSQQAGHRSAEEYYHLPALVDGIMTDDNSHPSSSHQQRPTAEQLKGYYSNQLGNQLNPHHL